MLEIYTPKYIQLCCQSMSIRECVQGDYESCCISFRCLAGSSLRSLAVAVALVTALIVLALSDTAIKAVVGVGDLVEPLVS